MKDQIEITAACKVAADGSRQAPLLRLIEKPQRGEWTIERRIGDLRARTFRSFATAKKAYAAAVAAAGLTIIRNAAGEVA